MQRRKLARTVPYHSNRMCTFREERQSCGNGHAHMHMDIRVQKKVNYLRGWSVGGVLNELINSAIISIHKHAGALLKGSWTTLKKMSETRSDLISGSIWRKTCVPAQSCNFPV